MLKVNLCVLVFALCLVGCKQKSVTQHKPTESFVPPIRPEVAIQRADSIMDLMSLEEKLQLIKGYKTFFIKGFEKYGLPQVYLSDATQGVHLRNSSKFDLGEQLEKSTAFPCPIELASTWNPDLAGKYALSIGEECRAGGIGILLGPGMNIYRVAQNGRNFEYMGEDPFLVSRMIERYVVAMQSTGTISTLKHFVANNHEYKRRACNVKVSERALHEIYMPAFKAGIDAGAMAVMTGYNLVNGEWCGQSDYLINGMLRNELGFDWLVMTDWVSVLDSKKVVQSGQDLEMPGGESMHNLADLLASGEVKESEINRMVRSILKTIIAMGFMDRPQKNENYLKLFSQHAEVALNTAREGIVLLKNEGQILPISPESSKRILLTGKYIEELATGKGSANVKGYDQITLKSALSNTYSDLKYLDQPSDDEILKADVVIVSVGTSDSEAWDHFFRLPEDQELLIKRLVSLNKNVIVIVNSGGGVRMTDWNDEVAAIVYNWYGGQVGNQALAEVLSGKINPSGHLPITIEKDFSDSPGADYLPEVVDLNKIHAIRTMKEADTSIYDVEYDEGVLVGYRWYDTKNINPLYHFGYGLSYTRFQYSNMQLSSPLTSLSKPLTVTFDVQNIGDRNGATVAQIYVQDVESSVVRPLKELKGFSKVDLASGETKSVTIELDNSAFSFWDYKTRKWKIETGEFMIHLGESSGKIVQSKVLKVEI